MNEGNTTTIQGVVYGFYGNWDPIIKWITCSSLNWMLCLAPPKISIKTVFPPILLLNIQEAYFDFFLLHGIFLFGYNRKLLHIPQTFLYYFVADDNII